MGEDVTDDKGAGPLLPAAIPGLGGRDVLLSDTCEKERWRGFRARDLCRGCLPVLVSQSFLQSQPHICLHTLSFIPPFTSHL